MITALFVDAKGPYMNDSRIDAWDSERDATLYQGPNPVIAHPPCQRWCQLAAVNQARYGLPIGADGGLFEFALAAVRKYGGLVEHPAYSIAYKHFGILRPSKQGWARSPCGGWVCQVAQRNYGHRARKLTWLYLYGYQGVPPDLIWGNGPKPEAWISADRPLSEMDTPMMMNKRERLLTPAAFKELLISLVGNCKV